MKIPRTILVVVPLRIGDVLLATPVMHSLRLAYPEARIDALVFSGTEGALQRNPDINDIITVAARPRFMEHLRLLVRLFRRYDLAVTTLLGDRPTLYAWLAGKRSIGMQDGSDKERWKRHLLSDWAEFDHINTHTVLTNLGLMDVLGIARSHEVVAAWDSADQEAIVRLLPFDLRAERYAVLHLSPKFRYKMWHGPGWIALARWLELQGVRIILTGGKDRAELDYVETIRRDMPASAVNLSGKLTLAQTAFLISRAWCYVGPDTALTHMAAALGTSTVALFGPSNPVKWGPWPRGYAENRNPYAMKGTQRVNNVVLVQGEGDCVPCMEEGCDRHNDSASLCLQQMQADTVIAALQTLVEAEAPALST